MIVPADLLSGLQRLLKRLEPDFRRRCEANDKIDARLRAEYEKARSASRTAQAYEVWREDYITQVAVAWILGCVFVRFLEDNHLIDTAWLAGPNERLQLARDQHTLYFQANPTHSDREYLEHVFGEVAKLPSMRDLLNGSHNPISKLGPTGDGAHELLEFWQKVDPSTGVILYDFTDPEWNTRFLGDLYQNLSESARKRYALLQTPEFVEEFILDRTLTPAVNEFGYSTVKMIDPACGSGHFLLGGFYRLMQVRLRSEPGVPVRSQAQSVLNQVYGIDVNPFAVAIARFRLFIAVLQICDIKRLTDAPSFKVNVAVGDSLLHGPSPRGFAGIQRTLEADPLQHYYDIEDAELIQQLLSDKYHVVVGNPPYINVRDRALREAYRRKFTTCSGKYQLTVPFLERFFDLAVQVPTAGFIGTITAIAFTKQSFGRKLVEEFLPKWELTHVIDTSRAHIPAHGTPTVILLARSRRPITPIVRMVRGIRGEKRRPDDPSRGAVWLAILNQVDRPGSESAWASVADVSRENLKQHPWAIGGGGAAELVERLTGNATDTLGKRASSIGITSFTLLDDVYCLSSDAARRHGIQEQHLRHFISGENIRDWMIIPTDEVVIFPYSDALHVIECDYRNPTFRYLWYARTSLANGIMFGGKTKLQAGLRWYEFGRLTAKKLRIPLSIAFCNITTHNHFALESGRSILNSHALVIKLLAESTSQEHVQLIGILNSSTAWLWMKQMCHGKGGGGIGGGIATETWEQFAELTARPITKFPLPSAYPTEIANTIQDLEGQLISIIPDRLIVEATPSRERFDSLRCRSHELLLRMISLQEELDWQVYRLYELTEESLTLPIEEVPAIELGQRAFEIVMARKMAAGELETSWFERHRSVPITDIPSHWPGEYRKLVNKRIAVIESDRNIGLIEQPEYKRRWKTELWEEQEARAFRKWLLNRMEDLRYWSTFELTSCTRLADCLRSDADFRQVAELYRGRADFDLAALVVELAEAKSVPFLPTLRYTDAGLRKRAIWERTWDMQRGEDRIDAEVQANSSIPEIIKQEVAKSRKTEEVGEIPPPPKYESQDFRNSSYWGLRGQLDVPKERFISFPFCERDVDQTPVIGWAGWNHLQQAQAIAAYYERVKNHEGWTPDRRVPLLAGILELLPWLKQWHNDIHPEYKERMSDFFQQFVEDEARAMDMTMNQIRAWTPPVQSRTRRRRRSS